MIEEFGQPLESNAGRRSPMRGALLAMILQHEPIHAYALALAVSRRLGPAWGISPKAVYPLLDRLEREGLISSSMSLSRNRLSGQRVYRATERTEVALTAWMGCPVPHEGIRGELQARIAVSRPKDGPMLLAALSAYETECLRMLHASKRSAVRMDSWSGLAMSAARVAADEHLRAQLQWIDTVRGWIEDFQGSL